MGLFGKVGKKRLGFWAGDQNNFQFIDPLIEVLGSDYKVEKFYYAGDDEQLKREMETVDLCWFEWCGGPVIPASKFEKTKPIINRAHRFELYLNEPKLVNWHNVDRTIFSSPSMILRFQEKFPAEYSIAAPELIPIGVDTDRFKFVDKETTKNIIYVGRIHPHKNPTLLLQIFAKLLQRDPEYTLTVIGGFSDELYEEYFNDQVKKLGLSKNLKHIGKLPQPEIVQHLQDADHFLITSIIEGLSQASLEAMACGARPVIDDYYGSEKAYPEKCIYKTVDEAVELICNPSMTRLESRQFIDNNYRLDDKAAQIRNIIKELLK